MFKNFRLRRNLGRGVFKIFRLRRNLEGGCLKFSSVRKQADLQSFGDFTCFFLGCPSASVWGAPCAPAFIGGRRLCEGRGGKRGRCTDTGDDRCRDRSVPFQGRQMHAERRPRRYDVDRGRRCGRRPRGTVQTPTGKGQERDNGSGMLKKFRLRCNLGRGGV